MTMAKKGSRTDAQRRADHRRARRQVGSQGREAGFDVEESVRLDPELSDALRERAEQEGRTNSDLIRDALRRYLQAS
jgi:hypothetical protein